MDRDDDHLESQIMAAFERALDTGRADVAEHLLRALELIEPTPVPGSYLA